MDEIDSDKKKGKGCPKWIYILLALLGLLLLAALVIGLLFFFGVLGITSDFNPDMYTIIEEEAVLSTDPSNPIVYSFN